MMVCERRILRAIRNAVNENIPQWEISELLYRHNCYELLSRLFEGNIIHQKVKSLLSINKIALQERYKACQGLFKSLSNIDYAVVKGAVLSKAIYGSECLRVSSDIDLFIKTEDMSTILQILTDLGFVQGRVNNGQIEVYSRAQQIYYTALTHQAAPFVKKNESVFCPYVNIDVNYNMHWGESLRKADLSVFRENLQFDVIYGVHVKKLAPISELIFLCMHHYKDMNSLYLLTTGSLKLCLFLDIHYFILKHGHDININILSERCDYLKVKEYVYYCLYYTYKLLRCKQLKPYLSALKTPAGSILLGKYGLTSEEQKSWEIGFFQRLFDEDLPVKLDQYLTSKDRTKIQTNRKFMY